MLYKVVVMIETVKKHIVVIIMDYVEASGTNGIFDQGLTQLNFLLESLSQFEMHYR